MNTDFKVTITAISWRIFKKGILLQQIRYSNPHPSHSRSHILSNKPHDHSIFGIIMHGRMEHARFGLDIGVCPKQAR
jgi:hypothetical protein